MDSDLIRGNVDTVILKVLYEGDRYGYDMIKQINARSGGQWEIKQPTLYACLKRLEKQGFVGSYWDDSESSGGRRKYYTLTDRGREVFVTYKNEWERSRDLFGELINGDEAMLAVDDFSDVEDEDYAIPKRKSKPRPKKKPIPSEPEAPETVIYDPPSFAESEYRVAIEEPATQPAEEKIEDTLTDARFADESEPAVAPNNPEPVQSETGTDRIVEEREEIHEEQKHDDAVILDDEPEEAIERKIAPEPERQTVAESTVSEQSYVKEEQRPSLEPRAVIDELYASTYTSDRSYADARSAAYIDYDAPVTAPQKQEPVNTNAISAEVKPASPAAPPAPIMQPESPAPVLYNDGRNNEESLARREYRDILGELVDRTEAQTKRIEQAEQTEESAATESTIVPGGERIEIKRFESVKQEMTDLGNDVTVKAHNDSAKQYTQKYHYYSNKLRIKYYPAMCITMLAIALVCTFIFKFGAKINMRYDVLLYVFTALLPVVMLSIAAATYARDPLKQKRARFNFTFTIFIRCIIMLQALVVIYCLNLIWGMPVGFSADYIPSLVLPAIYTLFIPGDEIAFMCLIKTGAFAVE